jgi:hypothetical protein
VNPGLKPWAETSCRFAAANVPPSRARQALCDSHHRATGGSLAASRQLASNLAPFQQVQPGCAGVFHRRHSRVAPYEGDRVGGDVNPGLKPWAEASSRFAAAYRPTIRGSPGTSQRLPLCHRKPSVASRQLRPAIGDSPAISRQLTLYCRGSSPDAGEPNFHSSEGSLAAAVRSLRSANIGRKASKGIPR